jgi:hypothetical protein
VDFVDEQCGQVTATLHRNFCSAVRRDLRRGEYLKEKWRVELDCRYAGLPEWWGAALLRLWPNNCKCAPSSTRSLWLRGGISSYFAQNKLIHVGGEQRLCTGAVYPRDV